MKEKPQLIVALDVDTADEAKKLVDELKPIVNIFKVGSQLFTREGPQVVQLIQKQGKKIFLDLKFHDIPQTVSYSTSGAIVMSVNPQAQSAGIPGLFMLTVHTLGGKDMLQAAAQASKKTAGKYNVPPPLVVGVTVLTSVAKDATIEALVLARAQLAKEAGLDGVVASVEETALIRRYFGEDFIIVTPGIRPAGVHHGDQKRVATPTEAIRQGSNYLVVGRPILEAPSPYEAAQNILAEIENADVS